MVNPFADAADVPRRQDPHPARSYEIPGADPRGGAAAPASAGRQARSSTAAGGPLHRGRRRRHRGSPIGSPMRCSAARSTSCRRRRGAAAACIDALGRSRVRKARHGARRSSLYARVRCATDGLGRHPVEGPSEPPGRLNTCSSHRGKRARALSMSCFTMARARREAVRDRPARP